MKLKCIILTFFAVFCACAVFCGATAFAEDKIPEFTDVTASHPHYNAIVYCAENNFINGKSETAFAPDDVLTREQLALIWARTFHVKRVPHTFRDVASFNGGEADVAIVVLHGLGLINGVSPTEFGRYSPITREQAITIAARTYLPFAYDGKEADKYEDSGNISAWAYEAVSKCLKEGELTGVFPDGKLLPKNPITRGELCRLIYNLMGGDEAAAPSPKPSPTDAPSPEPSGSPKPTGKPAEDTPPAPLETTVPSPAETVETPLQGTD